MFELEYRGLVTQILDHGQYFEGRNGTTTSIFGQTIEADLSDGAFPLLTSRKIHYTGVLGELCAIIRGPKHIDDFKRWGCNYWDAWAKEDGSIDVDYGNAWIDYNGVNQLERLRIDLMANPRSRRLLIDAWRADRVLDLSLPCCHYAYQWYVRYDRDYRYLDMMMHMRSVDVMVGLPSDMVFAATLNILLANEAGMLPGRVVITMGDAHIYQVHNEQAVELLARPWHRHPSYSLLALPYADIYDFAPEQLVIKDYFPGPSIKMELVV